MDKKLLSRLAVWVAPYKMKILAALVFMVAASLLNVVPAWFFKTIIDDVLLSRDKTMLTLVCVAAITVFALKGIATYVHQTMINWVGQRVIMDIRIVLYDHLQRMSLRAIHGSRIGEMISRITNDVATLQSLMTSTIVGIIVNGVTFVGMIFAIFWLNWRLSLFTMLLLPPVAWLLSYAAKLLRRTGHQVQSRIANLTAIVQEAFSAVRIVRSFATEEQELARFRVGNAENFDALMKGVRIHSALSGVVEVLLIGVLAFIVWLGGSDVINGVLTPGELVAFLGYLGFLVAPIRTFMSSLNGLENGFAAIERIFETLDVEIDIVEPSDPLVIDKLDGHISFDNVTFAYAVGIPVLRRVCLDVRPGERVALVGPTGSGKSTLADLVLRFYDPDEGVVRIDGHDVREFSLTSLRRQIGVVPQDPVLMKGTVLTNISYGLVERLDEGVLRERVIEAAKVAGVHEFVDSLPDKYDTEVGERGVTLSGGQRQRVAIARAVIRNPRILILDEATSSLDIEVERQVQEAMNRAMHGRTSLVIAHRLTTVRNADRIIVLNAGEIIEEGNHDRLMEKNGLYAHLYNLQFVREGAF